MKKIVLTLVLITLIILATGCTQNSEKISSIEPTNSVSQGDASQFEWNQVIHKAKGTKVTFYGWGGSQQVNTWLDTSVKDFLFNNYQVTLERIPMNIDEILNKLLGEKQLDAEGTIDVVWINGENFATAKTNNLLFGPFTNLLPNFNTYIDPNNFEVKNDFGYATEGYEAPFGKAQLVMIADSLATELPKNHLDLMLLAKENPGRLTYPALPDFTGSAFVRNIIYEIVGQEAFRDIKADKDEVMRVIQPALDYLLELKPYLWMDGKTYPSSAAQLDNMYSDGEVLMTMSYNPNHVAGKIQTGEFSKSSLAFVFDKGTVGNTHFLAIPYNSPNKEAALVVINALLSPELQSSKYHPQVWGDLPVLDNSKLSVIEKNLFAAVPLGEGVPNQEELLSKRIPEMPVHLIPIIEEIWMELIPGE